MSGRDDHSSSTRPEPETPGTPGTTDDRPRWEGPEETRPSGYKPAVDDPDRETDAAGESNSRPDRKTLGDGLRQRGD
jgi:hypothetical protein